MKYKAIISDFDGTLVGPELVITPQVKSAVSNVLKQGYSFSIASGRLFNGVIQNTCQQLNLTGPQITKGGAEIVDAASGRVMDGEYIPDHIAKEIIVYLLSLHAFFFIEKGDTAYTVNGKPIEITSPIEFKKIDELVIHDVPKIAIRLSDNYEIDERLKKQYPILNIVATHNPSEKEKYCDVTAPSANKHIAVLKVAKILNITPEEIIGIGDGYNDFPLLEACGYKIAMGNAAKELKEIADYIVPSYSEDGVAVFIQQLLTQEKFQ